MHNSLQLQRFIHNLVHIPNPATKLPPGIVQDIMRQYQLLQPDVYYRVDESGCIKELGQGIERLTGFTRTQLTGARLDAFFVAAASKHEYARTPSPTTKHASFHHAHGNHVPVLIQSRPLYQVDKYSGHEGLIYRRRTQGATAMPDCKHIPLLFLSLSGGILSCNASARGLLDEWQCAVGDSLPDHMQDQVLDAWLAGHALCFDSYAYFPVMHEGIILLSTISHSTQPVKLPAYSLQWHAHKKLPLSRRVSHCR